MTVSMMLYTSITLAFIVYGTGVTWRGIHGYGLGTIWLGIVNTITWLVWLAGGDMGRNGLAIPEFIGALALAIWTLWTASRLLATPPR
ncbi:MAG: hypothetical protein U5K37_03480 [Natrialbaceae archaeon]|nr:hypothetical protein [Natrialbaceae archaeon]